MDIQICIFNCVRWMGLRDKGEIIAVTARRERENEIRFANIGKVGNLIFCPMEKEFLVVAVRFWNELILVDSFN